MVKKELQKFEKKIADAFDNAEIKAPIHLYDNNEDQMIEIFEDIDIENDWVCCTWRNHYQGLLKGIPPEVMEANIREGKSMVANLPQYKFICSSIVGGIPSIATGIALSIKLQAKKNRVWCWVGDMTAETGVFHEAYKYSRRHNLPLEFVIEDNNMSTNTPTDETWCGLKTDHPEDVFYYSYERGYPHHGTGTWVLF